MKLRLISFAMLALLAFASCRSDKLTGPTNNPTVSDTIAHWTFDGSTSDVSGNGHDGSITGTGASFGKTRFGIVGPDKSLVLDHQTSMVVASKSDLNILTANSYTISAWVWWNNPDTGYSSGTLISKMTQRGQSAEATGYRIITAGYLYPLVGKTYLADIYSEAAGNDDFALGADPVTSSFYPINYDEWHLVTLVIDAHKSMALYVDSVLITSLPYEIKDQYANNDVPLTIGPMPDGSAVDDVLMLHHAMTASEVSARFHEGGWYQHIDTVVTPPPGPWNPVTSNTTENLVIGQFVNSTAGFVSGSNGVFLNTADAGNTWNLQSYAPVFSGSNTGAIYGISFLDATTGFAVGDQRDISLTTNAGLTWNPMDASNVPQSDLIRSIYFTNRNTGFVGTSDAYAAPSGSICASTDGGLTWNPIFTTQGGIYNINFIPGTTNGVALGRFGVCYWTSDGGTTWNAGSTGKPNSIITRSTFTSATTGFAVGSDLSDTNGFVLKTNDGGHTWQTVAMTNYGLHGIASNGAGTITAVGNSGAIIESTDGGATWAKSFAGTSLWYDIRYASQKRAVLFGVNGNIAIRDK